MARSSSSEKPLAMRFMTVAGIEPSRNPVIAVMISLASRPFSRLIDVPVPWQPEQDAAPGGGAEAASAGMADAMTAATDIAMREAFIICHSEGGAAVPWDHRSFDQAKLIFWSFSGIERMRLPVAAK